MPEKKVAGKLAKPEGAKKSAKSTTADDKKREGFSDEERAAMKERAKELKAASRPARAAKADGESDVLATLAAMPEPDRGLGERLHAIIKASAPALSSKLWYGMPAYAKDGKVVCFFQSRAKVQNEVCDVRVSCTRRTSTKAPCGRLPSRLRS